MQDYRSAVHVLRAISYYDPEALILEIEEIGMCIKENKKYEEWPTLSRKDLALVLESFIEDEGRKDILIERTIRRISNEGNVRAFIRNVLTS